MKKLTRDQMKRIIGGYDEEVPDGGGSTCVDCGSAGIMCGSASRCREAQFGGSTGLTCTNASGTVASFTACPR